MGERIIQQYKGEEMRSAVTLTGNCNICRIRAWEMLPGSALMPATSPELRDVAERAGRRIMKLVKIGLKLRDMATMDSFENGLGTGRDPGQT